MLAYCVIFVFSLSGNAIIVYIVSTKPYLKSLTNFLIANMAGADLLMTFCAMPYSVLYVFIGSRWIGGILGKVTCKLLHFSVALSIAASIATLVAIAIDRFYAIVYPFKRGMGIWKNRVTIAVIWSFSTVFMSPYLYSYTVQEQSDGNAHCIVAWEPLADTFLCSRIYFVIVFISLYAIPLTVIAALYSIICRKLWFRKIPGNPSIAIRRNADLSKRRTIKMLVIVVVVFAICWFPAHTMHYCIYYRHDMFQTFSPYLVLFAFWVSHANSCANPYLYIILNKNFRRAFLDLLKKCFSCKARPVVLHTTSSQSYLTQDVSLRNVQTQLWRGRRVWRAKHEPSKWESRENYMETFGVDLLKVVQTVTSSESSF